MALIKYVNGNLNNSNRHIKLIWLAEGLFEYLKSKQQIKTIELITSVTKELIQHFQNKNKTAGNNMGFNVTTTNTDDNNEKNIVIENHIVIPFLGKAIDIPLKEHYGARFGWKFSNLEIFKDILNRNDWIDDNNGKEEEEQFAWGNLLQFHRTYTN